MVLGLVEQSSIPNAGHLTPLISVLQVSRLRRKRRWSTCSFPILVASSARCFCVSILSLSQDGREKRKVRCDHVCSESGERCGLTYLSQVAPMAMLQLPLPLGDDSAVPFDQLITEYYAPEQLTATDWPRKEACRKCASATGPWTITAPFTPGNLLLIQVKRAHSVGQREVVVSREITHIPERLVLPADAGVKAPYKLMAIACYLGTQSDNGHYVVFRLGPGKLWFRCDDEMVSAAMPFRAVAADEDVRRGSYLLAYVKEYVLYGELTDSEGEVEEDCDVPPRPSDARGTSDSPMATAADTSGLTTEAATASTPSAAETDAKDCTAAVSDRQQLHDALLARYGSAVGNNVAERLAELATGEERVVASIGPYSIWSEDFRRVLCAAQHDQSAFLRDTHVNAMLWLFQERAAKERAGTSRTYPPLTVVDTYHCSDVYAGRSLTWSDSIVQGRAMAWLGNEPDIIFIPVEKGQHWSLVVLDTLLHTATIFDSLATGTIGDRTGTTLDGVDRVVKRFFGYLERAESLMPDCDLKDFIANMLGPQHKRRK